MSAAVETAQQPAEGAATPAETNAAQNPEVIASAAEGVSMTAVVKIDPANSFVGRRLYIGNLAYATTEGELKTFFKEFLVYVISSLYTHRNKVTNVSPANLSQSRSTREPLARLDMPSSISQLRPRLNVPSPNSTVRPFSIGKFPSSLHGSRKHTVRALQAVVRVMAIPTVDARLSEAVAVAGDVAAGLFAVVVL